MTAEHDLVLRGGDLYDGSGAPPRRGDLAVAGDSIAEVGEVSGRGRLELDVSGLAVAPGFINVLSWANETLIEDGRSQSDVRQGVTLEVLGEGSSMGPLNAEMKELALERQGDIRYPIGWTTLGEYLAWLAARGVSCNVASFVGATTARVHELGFEDRDPTPDELSRMRALVRQAMREGALGLSSALIYPPATFAATEELVALARTAGELGGLYISHLRSEGARLLEAVDELVTIAREGKVRAEIYHLKAAGRTNWPKFEQALQRVEAARAQGLAVTADMYTYAAAATGLSSCIPPWYHEGGHKALVERLRDLKLRPRIAREMREPSQRWENLFREAGSPENILLNAFRSDALKPLTGKTLAQVSAMRGRPPEEVVMDLVVEDDSRVGAVYFVMDEANVRLGLAQPWVSFGSDGGSQAPEGNFLKSMPHPRSYGNVARLLGRYVREERVLALEEAVRRLTWLPAENLRLERRGRLRPGDFADVAVFDPDEVQDHATFEEPQRYATGVEHVLVNGVLVLKDGEHTDARPGRFLRGPGFSR